MLLYSRKFLPGEAFSHFTSIIDYNVIEDNSLYHIGEILVVKVQLCNIQYSSMIKLHKVLFACA